MEGYDPARINEKRQESAPAEPYADIARMHSPYELEELIKMSEGERKTRAIERLKEVLQAELKGLATAVNVPYTDNGEWAAKLRDQKARVEERLKSLESEG
jgi:hypothetical protein